MRLLSFPRFPAFGSGRAKPTAATLGGWTPGVRTLIRGRVLPCGCVAGLYETWWGTVVTIVDSHGRGCPIERHETDDLLESRSESAG